jgi:hypothetical protein
VKCNPKTYEEWVSHARELRNPKACILDSLPSLVCRPGAGVASTEGCRMQKLTGNVCARAGRRWGVALFFGIFASPVHAGEVPAASRLLNLAPAAFAPTNSAFQYTVEAGGLGRLCSLKGSGYVVAPLHLADGAVIERVSAVVQDTNIEGMALVSLARRTPEDLQVLAISPVFTGAHDLETLSVDSITTPVVDNQKYAYLLQVVLTSTGVCLRGAQVTYRNP